MQDSYPVPYQCGVAPAVDELDLLAAADGEASDAILAHIAACPQCSARVRQFRELQQQLRRRLFRAFCPPSDTLLAFQQGALPPMQREAIEEHLASCPHCSSELALFPSIARPPLDPWPPPQPRLGPFIPQIHRPQKR